MSSDGSAARAYHMLGNYEINATVGKGGMGVVYRAHDHILNRTVALKVLREDLRVQESLVSRFEREARAVAALDHPNIVHVYSVGSIDEIPYIAMEFIDGRPLNEVLKRNKRLDWEPTLSAGAQVAHGLAAAHEKGIIHRDIKPGNILITRDGHAYITDFGIAKVLSADTQLTVDGSRLGTPHYMAPERCEGLQADDLGDIYSLGIVLYQCISGELPFDAKTPATLIEQIASEPIPRLAETVPGVPKDVDRLVAWMTEKDPRHRPANARVLAEAIERVAAGMPLEEEGPNLADALAEFRDKEATPAPQQNKVTPKKKKSKTAKRIAKAVGWWRGIHFAGQAVIISIVALAMGGVVGPFVLTPRLHDPVIAIAQSPDAGALRWQSPPSPAVFQEEGASVWTARIQLEHFAIAELASNPNGATVLMVGNEGTDWAGYDTVLTIDPNERGVAFIEMPTLQPTTGKWRIASSALYRSHAGLLTWQHFSDSAANRWTWNDADHRLNHTGQIALGPDGSAAIVVQGVDDPTREFIVAPVLDNSGQVSGAKTISGRGAPIKALAFSRDGSLVAYAREAGPGFQSVHVVNTNGSGRDSLPIAEGELRLAYQPFTRNGRGVAVVRGSDAPEIAVIRRADGDVMGKPVPGTDATIHARTNTLVYISDDRHGQKQVWTTSLDRASMATQRTFIEGGVRSRGLAVAGDFVCAVVAEADGPTLACVDVTAAP